MLQSTDFFKGLFLVAILNINAIAQSNMCVTDSVEIMTLDATLHSRSQLGGVCVDRLGYIYVSNFYDAVWRVSPEGSVKLLTDGLYGSSGNCIDAKGNLYQANFYANSIVKIDRFGDRTTYVEQNLNGPVGMTFDTSGNLYVCNFNDNNILQVNTDMQISIFATSDLFNGPNGITIDNQGFLYVVNFNNSKIIRIDQVGVSETFSTTAGVDGNAHITFFNNKFYVTKIKTNQIFVVNSVGDCKLLSGSINSMEISSGPASEATFSAPNGIAVDALTGSLYVNNLNGEWTSRMPSTIEISRIKLSTLPQILTNLLDDNKQEDAVKAFWTYHRDSFNLNEDLGPQLSALGWQYMARRNVAASIFLFDLLSQAYPNRWRPYYYLGEVYKIINQREKARDYYQLALERDPSNTQVQSRLSDLE